jgi:hypothetical protein
MNKSGMSRSGTNKSSNPAPVLVWDIDKLRLSFMGIEVAVAHPGLSPFNVSALVEEQDTDRVLGECTEIRDHGDKPVWYLANKLSSAPQKKTGGVIVRGQQPFVFQAIIHNLSEDPSWRREWIAETLDNIFTLTKEKNIPSIKLPALGNVHGRFGLENFIILFTEKLGEFASSNNETKRNWPLQKVWLEIPVKQYQQAFLILKNQVECYEKMDTKKEV